MPDPRQAIFASYRARAWNVGQNASINWTPVRKASVAPSTRSLVAKRLACLARSLKECYQNRRLAAVPEKERTANNKQEASKMDRSPVFIAGFDQFDIVYVPEKNEIESRFRSENMS